MDLDVAHGAILAGLEVLHNTTLAESMKTLCDGGSIHEVASAQAADDVLIQVFDLYSDLLLWTHPLVTDHSPQPQPLSLPQLGSRLFRQTPRPNPTPCVVSRVLAPGG